MNAVLKEVQRACAAHVDSAHAWMCANEGQLATVPMSKSSARTEDACQVFIFSRKKSEKAFLTELTTAGETLAATTAHERIYMEMQKVGLSKGIWVVTPPAQAGTGDQGPPTLARGNATKGAKKPATSDDIAANGEKKTRCLVGWSRTGPEVVVITGYSKPGELHPFVPVGTGTPRLFRRAVGMYAARTRIREEIPAYSWHDVDKSELAAIVRDAGL